MDGVAKLFPSYVSAELNAIETSLISPPPCAIETYTFFKAFPSVVMSMKLFAGADS